MEKTALPTDLDADHGIFGTLFLLTNSLETISNRYLKELTTKQWFLLAVMTTLFDAPPTVSQLAEQMGVSHQNVKMVTTRLANKGFVTLERDTSDKRAWRVVLTKKAEAYGAQNDALQTAFLNELFFGIPQEEKAICLQVLMQLVDRLKEMKHE